LTSCFLHGFTVEREGAESKKFEWLARVEGDQVGVDGCRFGDASQGFPVEFHLAIGVFGMSPGAGLAEDNAMIGYRPLQ
jgi:hypothetical protein